MLERSKLSRQSIPRSGLVQCRLYRMRHSRHSYSSLLRRMGADIKVQQELLRHSTIQSTMNVYTQAMPEGKRAANSVVVRSVLPFEACCGIGRKLEWEPIATEEHVSG